MKRLGKGCHALIVALIMAICCNFIAFGDEVAAPAESAVESVTDDTADDLSVSESTNSETDETADSDSEPDGSESEGDPEPEEKKDDNQSSFDSGNKEDHSSFDEWGFPEPENPAPQPEPTPEPTPEPEPQPEPAPEPAPEPEKPEIPVTPIPEPEVPVVPEPEHWHDDDDDDDDIVVVIPKMPVVTAGTDEVPVVKTFEVPSGDTLPVPETPVVEIPETPGSELPKTGDSGLPLYAFLASAFGLALLISSSFIGRHNADETVNKKPVSAHPQMCCGLQETEKSGKDVNVKATRSSRTKNAPSHFGLRCWHCIKIVLALTHPGGGFLYLKTAK